MQGTNDKDSKQAIATNETIMPSVYSAFTHYFSSVDYILTRLFNQIHSLI